MSHESGTEGAGQRPPSEAAPDPSYRFPCPDVTSPTLIDKILPEYSEEGRRARRQGSVLLDAIVQADGSIEVLGVSRSLGLDEKAVEAVLKWMFRPATRNGEPVAVAMSIRVNFTLR